MTLERCVRPLLNPALCCLAATVLAVGQDVKTAGTTAAATNSSSATPPPLLLTGIAAIGEKRLIYLTDVMTSQVIELVTGGGPAQGIELLQVDDRGMEAAWKVQIRHHGVESWLNFAAPSQLATAATVATLTAASGEAVILPEIKRAPSKNAGTMSNDTPSASLRKRPANSYPLPAGL